MDPLRDKLDQGADVITVVGTRPQLVKASEVSRALERVGVRELLVHTGQHYDHNMSAGFSEDLGLRPPDVNLHIGGGPHGQQTGQMLDRLEAIMIAARPARPRVLVYGDCNSTLAGALAAAKLGLRVDHVEAGLRSFQRDMPEEINRVLTDRLSSLLLCPTEAAVEHLRREGLTDGVHLIGDVMCDAVERQIEIALKDDALGRHLSGVEADPDAIRAALGVGDEVPLPQPGAYRVATIHRASNTDDPEVLRRLLDSVAGAPDRPTWLLLHPRTRARIGAFGLTPPAEGLILAPPASYRATLALVRFAHQLLTDSGGLQKEALMLGTPCVTLRAETEWTETVQSGWNTLVGADPAKIKAAMAASPPHERPPRLYGDGRAAQRIAALIKGAVEAQEDR